MAGTIIVSSIKTDTDNSFIVRSNTGATLFSVDTTTISIPDGSITSAMIANGTVIAADILDGTITDAKIAAVANTKITGNIISSQITSVANTQVTGLITAGQIASVANTQITGNITQAQIATGVAGTGPAFSAYAGTTASISPSTWTKVTLSSEIYDTANAFDSSTNYRFTPQVAGYYHISAGARVEGVNANNKILGIYKNGSVLYTTDTYTLPSVTYNPSYMPITIAATIYLNGSTDYIELYGYSNGTSTAISGGLGGTNTAPWGTYMTGFLARSA